MTGVVLAIESVTDWLLWLQLRMSRDNLGVWLSVTCCCCVWAVAEVDALAVCGRQAWVLLECRICCETALAPGVAEDLLQFEMECPTVVSSASSDKFLCLLYLDIDQVTNQFQ